MGLPRPAKAQHFAAQTLVTNQTVDLPELPGIELLMMHRWAVLSLGAAAISFSDLSETEPQFGLHGASHPYAERALGAAPVIFYTLRLLVCDRRQ
jgi:hypothetical protein